MASSRGYDGIHRTLGNHEDQEKNKLSNNEAYSGDSYSSTVQGLTTTTKLRTMLELAAQKHAFSERKRRKRINNHYDSLRQFFPRLLKTDKASVLTETVRRLKELKNMVVDVSQSHDDGGRCSGNGSQRSFFIPDENDEMTVRYCGSGNNKTVRVIICCEDRPGLIQDMTETIQSVHGKAVKAEMATVGGRTKAEVVVEWPECGGGGEDDVESLKRALKAVVENRVLGQSRLMGNGCTEPELIGLGRGPKVYDQRENRLADGLIIRS
ncbi:transcription factor bHLH131-like [Cynara cardunculus var. scolymus]|uniref:transcription factor bHLH131-like n=1 Tax=Cynara cardunculus var. scolymus TaxID=59895 RepID=UPI000D62AB11|nr:transcription factor bHLH131-like [Cynara cardunculus var. scolymus]